MHLNYIVAVLILYTRRFKVSIMTYTHMDTRKLTLSSGFWSSSFTSNRMYALAYRYGKKFTAGSSNTSTVPLDTYKASTARATSSDSLRSRPTFDRPLTDRRPTDEPTLFLFPLLLLRNSPTFGIMSWREKLPLYLRTLGSASAALLSGQLPA
jgi:hypothetical protein